MDISSRLSFLFDKYLQRDCSPQEIEELFFLLQEAEAEDSLTPQMKQLWEEVKNDGIRYKVDWEKMYASVVTSEKQADVIINRATSRKRWLYYTMAAAIFIMAVVPAYLFLNRSAEVKPVQEDNIVLKKDNPKNNDRQTIHLPDGSTVILNAGSKLNYPSAFGTKHRDVYLTGEGFFDITHNPAKPFYVHAGKVTIKVLGTSFNIKAYTQEDNVEVTVTRGKVQVLKEDKVMGTLTASQQILLNNQTGDAVTKTVDTIPVIAWKPAEIFFNDITMEEAAEKLSKRFDIKIEFLNPAILQCRVTATFSEDDLPAEILTVICAVANASYTIVDEKFIIEGKGCK